MPQAPNHPPAPVQEGVHPAIPISGKCAALKEEFGVKSNTHSKNTRGPSKGTSRDLGLQSHHILQDAQTDQIISRGSAIAVILQDSHGGSERGSITARQNERMNNKGAREVRPRRSARSRRKRPTIWSPGSRGSARATRMVSR
jgi:hypothetical protein